MTNERTILLVGRTGKGRSALANVISNTNNFKESEYGISESEGAQIGHFRLKGEDIIYHIVDAIGIGDNRFTEAETLNRLVNAVNGVSSGLNQIFFVISGRFTEEDVKAYNLLRTVYFAEDIGKYTTIVQTNFPSFRDPEQRRKNKEVMMSQNEDVAAILRSCRRLVHVNNLTEKENHQLRARNDCRAFLRNYLSTSCREIYQPRNLGDMHKRISDYLTERTLGNGQQSQINQLLEENRQLQERLNQLLTQQQVQQQFNSSPRFHQFMKRSGFKPKRSLEVIMFTSEEPTRFGISCLGSRLMAGSEVLARALKETVDGQNISFFDAARSAGYAKDQEDLSSVFMKKGTYSAFVELHIEQGPILEEEGISIGIVTAIAAPASIKVNFEGNGGHAGAVLMPFRNDVGLAAAELALSVEKHVLESGSVDTVGTVGILELHPGAINSIPSKSHLEIDTRDIDEQRRNVVIEKIHQSAITIAKSRGVKLSEFKIVNQDPPALSAESVIKAMELASQQLNLSHKLMISRAYHDSLFMARVSPMGMIFIPCYKGYSHKPEEYASIEDIANGVKVLAMTMAKLSFD